MNQSTNSIRARNHCNVCGIELRSQTLKVHQEACAEQLTLQALESSDPFLHWKVGVALDHVMKFEESASEFKQAAEFFFVTASKQTEVAKAMFEYSTLMDAFSNTEQGRRFLSKDNFSDAANALPRASEILRSTLHFAFLAPYISACATLETVAGMEIGDEDTLQAYRTANALLEQAKFALGFSDETHVLITVIDAYLKYSISEALQSESRSLFASGLRELASDKQLRSDQVRREYEYLAAKAGLALDAIEFLPQRDFNERDNAPFILAYPDAVNLWLLNVGKNSAVVEKLGNAAVNQKIAPMSSASFELEKLAKGRIRVEYIDPATQEKHDEGCLTLI